jgi:hypothetical protein
MQNALIMPQFPGKCGGQMNLASVIVDTGGTIFFLLYGIVAGLVVYILVIAIEAMGMRFLEWDYFWRCLFDSWIINSISVAAGILAVFVAIDQVSPLVRIMQISSTFAGSLMLYIGALFISVVIEGGVLWVIRRRSAKSTWRMILIVNTASYIALVLLNLIWARLS